MTPFNNRHQEAADAALMRGMATETPGVVRFDLKKMSQEVAASLAATEAELLGRMMAFEVASTLQVRGMPLKSAWANEIWRAMLTAFARANNISLPETEDANL
jgi:hypothetical protein